jgi:tagatose 1,6-diphosphate aldolase
MTIARQLEPELLPPLVDHELELHLNERTLGDTRTRPPTYRFEMRVGGHLAGSISLRLGHSEYIEKYAGHIGYGVEPIFRGHRFAARACQLVFPVARRHGFRSLWITCNPENVASRRTCEIVGGALVDIVDVPPMIDLYREGDRQKCRYRVTL